MLLLTHFLVPSLFHVVMLPLQVFEHVVSDSARRKQYDLMAVVAYYGRHYITFCYHSVLKEWIYFDDAKFRKVAYSCNSEAYKDLILICPFLSLSIYSTSLLPSVPPSVPPSISTFLPPFLSSSLPLSLSSSSPHCFLLFLSTLFNPTGGQ